MQNIIMAVLSTIAIICNEIIIKKRLGNYKNLKERGLYDKEKIEKGLF